jgi:hypothetical protein
MSAARLQRVAFTTSRLAEFVGEKELTAQTGHPTEDWPLVIAKELTDNALDAAEEAQIAPKIIIEVSTERGEIILTDNGPGLPAETIDGVLDSHLLEAAKHRFVQMVCGFTTFNPHLTMVGRWDEIEFLDLSATDPDWHKWRTCDPTSAHWYDPERFERYAAAHLARDEDQGRTVRDFISELRGLARSGKQKLVLAETETSGMSLASFFEGGRPAVARLLGSCRRHTRPVKPEDLSLIGADHLLNDCCAVGAAGESFKYRKQLGTTLDGLPYVIEVAFAYCPEERLRRLITGVNSSIGIGNPFQRLGPFESLTSMLARRHVDYDDPVVAVLHYTCPLVDYVDRGKSTLALPRKVSEAIKDLFEAVTKDWYRQRRAELRHASAEANREARLLKEQQRHTKKEPAEPTGVLAQKICATAEALGVSIDSLVVLSPGNDPYTAWRRRDEAEWFAEAFDRFVAPGAGKHLRGLFYLLVSSPDRILGPDGKPFINDYKHWTALQAASKAARWLGLVAFERIIDERNAPPEIFVPGATRISTGVDPGTHCEIPITAEAALPHLYLAGFVGRQTRRIIFYGEKSSLSVVLRPIAERISAEMILVTGESSDSHIAGMAKRASEDGRPAVVFYFSDFDPSGHQMPISVARKLQALRDLYYPDLNIKLYHVALTLEQIRALALPSSPLKETERRASRWREMHGHDQTEIDAMVELHPEALRQAVFDAIRPFYDFDLDSRVLHAEGAWQMKAKKALKDHPGYKAASKRDGMEKREHRREQASYRTGSGCQNSARQYSSISGATRSATRWRSGVGAL